MFVVQPTPNFNYGFIGPNVCINPKKRKEEK